MATKVWKVDNQLRIEIDGETSYGNAVWYAISHFSETTVTLIYMGISGITKLTTINFADFQDELGTSYNTELSIANYLAPLIG